MQKLLQIVNGLRMKKQQMTIIMKSSRKWAEDTEEWLKLFQVFVYFKCLVATKLQTESGKVNRSLSFKSEPIILSNVCQKDLNHRIFV